MTPLNTALPQVVKIVPTGAQQILERHHTTVVTQINQRQTHGWKQPRRGPPAAYRNPNQR